MTVPRIAKEAAKPCVDSGAHPVLCDFKHVYGLTSETIVVAETVSVWGKINSFTFHTHKVKSYFLLLSWFFETGSCTTLADLKLTVTPMASG